MYPTTTRLYEPVYLPLQSTMTLKEILTRTSHLPASQIADAVNQSLADHHATIVTAPPGAGKSTLLPLTILTGGHISGKILMLEPRRIAARQIAERMSSLLDEPVGRSVGYRVRFETCVSSATRIEVLTEGILTRMLVSDPTLDGVGLVIFDEFHERNINSDLALALVRQTQQIIRPDLKILVMSATIDTDDVCSRLHAPLIKSQGRMYPVDIVYASDDTDVMAIPQTVAATVSRARREHSGDILAFLPGQGEIARCAELLEGQLSCTDIYQLYGNLSPEMQQRAIMPSADGRRRVVLATPIAETSLTIEGVRIVVDSGFCRSLVHDARTGMSHLETTRISMDMATQRAGRAGRMAEGTCYRLWTKSSEHLMADHREPEISYADLSSTLLGVSAFGENDIESLPWLTCPPHGNVMKVRQLLVMLGATDASGAITPLGKRMAALPCHPRMARMILCATSQTMKSLACDIAAILEEKDPMAATADSDMALRISALRSERRRNTPGRWARIAHIASEYRRMVRADEDNSAIAPHDVGMLIAHAYPERIARATDGSGHFRLASGDNVTVDSTDTMTAYSWIAIASLNTSGSNGRVFLAAPVDPACLDGHIVTERDNISWDSKQGCIVAQHERRIGKLTIDSKPIHDADHELIVRTVCEAAKKDGLSMFSWSDELTILQQRATRVAEWHPELGIPDISTVRLMASAAEWLPLYIDQNGRTMTTIAELKKIDMRDVAWGLIPYDCQMAIDRLAPTHIRVPTGSNIRIDYRTGAEAPVLSVRLQECFGMEQTPCVNDGRQPVLMELLSPGYKPVQLTQDLQSFWKNTYFEVRKELRRRYPKHYWPENPLEAEAVRGVRHTRQR